MSFIPATLADHQLEKDRLKLQVLETEREEMKAATCDTRAVPPTGEPMTAPILPAALEHLPIGSLTPYARNARTHSADQIAQLVASMREFGFTNPVLIDAQGEIIAGHGRVMAAQQLGLSVVPCLRLGHLSEVQKRAYVLADNKLALNAGWDEDLLALELQALTAAGFDLDLTGFAEGELEELLASLETAPAAEATEGYTEPEIDRAEELRQKWGVETGQLWQLGEHRLLCGDSTQAEDISRVMGSEKADLLLTDPPYGIGRDKGMGGKGVAGLCKRNPKQYAGGWDSDRPTAAVSKSLAMSKLAIIWGCNYYTDVLPLKSKWLIWDKEQTMPSYSDAEIAWTNLDGVSVKMFRYSGNGLLAKEKDRFHPTQKPVALFEWCLNQAEDVQTVYEPFSGSGTTLIACENLNRRCRAIEISPAYVAVALERWHQHTGRTPVRVP